MKYNGKLSKFREELANTLSKHVSCWKTVTVTYDGDYDIVITYAPEINSGKVGFSSVVLKKIISVVESFESVYSNLSLTCVVTEACKVEIGVIAFTKNNGVRFE